MKMSLRDRLIYRGIESLSKKPDLSRMIMKLIKISAPKIIARYDRSGIPYMGRMKTQLLTCLLDSLLNNIRKGWISIDYTKRAAVSYGGNQLFNARRSKIKRGYAEKHGIKPPTFLTISPTQQCNLRCPDCYADSTAKTAPSLNYETFRRLLQEARDMLGVTFVVISGGEPFIYRSHGKDLLDIAEEFNDMFFMAYTNGTLLSDEKVARMLDLGNLTPAISVEGYEEETDQRRGKGTYARILKSIERLHTYGVPFGISVTATSKNVNMLLRDRFYDYYFDELGALYMWMFHLMPIGRAADTMDLMPSAEQRLVLYHQFERMLFEKERFIADFWNGGGATDGCIAYGRPGGYFYVNWDGNIMPCVFIPYYKYNIYEIYAQGKTIEEVLMSDLFKRGRRWQHEYGFERERPKNWLTPCSIRDHYDEFREKVFAEEELKPENEAAAQALKDPKYYEKLVEFDEELEHLTQPIWQKKYLSEIRKRRRSSRKATKNTS